MVFAKVHAEPRVAAPPGSAPNSTVANRSRSAWVYVLTPVLLLVAAVWLYRGRVPATARQVPAPLSASIHASPLPAAAALGPLAAPTPGPDQAPLVPSSMPPARMTAADRARVESLIRKVNTRVPIAADDVRAAEELRARFADEPVLSQLLEAVLLGWSEQLRLQRALAAASEALQRAIALRPASLAPRLALLDLQLDREDWPVAAQTARDALVVDPRSASALEGLGRALLRLGRDQEASEALTRAGTPGATALLNKLRNGMVNESGMRHQELAAFTLRYDGEAHETVGREILRALDHHFATLTLLYDHRPSAPVQVILFSREQYYEAAQAPIWSGGVFDNVDGRIRVPIGGLDPKLTPQIESTLLHELTHAFVADITHGTAPRELHEGLAQFNEGKRLDSMLSSNYLTALADGRVGGVYGLYWGALAFAEYLFDMRGQSGINDLLRSMGETRDVNAAFRGVYGHDFNEMRQAAQQRLQQRYGS